MKITLDHHARWSDVVLALFSNNVYAEEKLAGVQGSLQDDLYHGKRAYTWGLCISKNKIVTPPL